VVYIGIAYDEQQRMSKVDGNLKYPLVDWKWTEQDCIDYLNKKDMFNPLYVNFDRLGCWNCPKQGIKSLYVLWKNYPNLWERFIEYDKENFRLTGKYVRIKPLIDVQKKFESGVIPKENPKYECWNGCESVKNAFIEKQCGSGLFVDLEDSELNNRRLNMEEKQMSASERLFAHKEKEKALKKEVAEEKAKDKKALAINKQQEAEILVNNDKVLLEIKKKIYAYNRFSKEDKLGSSILYKIEELCSPHIIKESKSDEVSKIEAGEPIGLP